MFKTLFKKKEEKPSLTYEILNLNRKIALQEKTIHDLKVELMRCKIPGSKAGERTKQHKKIVLKHLQVNGYITGALAWEHYKCYNLPATIHRLRGEGIQIRTDMIREKDYSYAKYCLVK